MNRFSALSLDDSVDGFEVGAATSSTESTPPRAQNGDGAAAPPRHEERRQEPEGHLMKLLRDQIRYQVHKLGQRVVYRTDQIFNLLSTHPIMTKNLLKVVAEDGAGTRFQPSLTLWQYRHYGKQWNIVADGRTDDYDGAHQSYLLQENIFKLSKEEAVGALISDAKAKFAKFVFYEDFDAAVRHIREEAKYHNIELRFHRNPNKPSKRTWHRTPVRPLFTLEDHFPPLSKVQ